MIITGRKIFVIITGASRGIGRQIALSLASDVAGDSAFLLLARNGALLEKVKQEIQELNPTARVATIVADLSVDKPVEQLDELVSSIADGQNAEARLIFHNAGSLGDLSKPAHALGSAEDWHKYLQANFVSMVTLNHQLFQLLNKDDGVPLFVVNVTSLASVMPMPSLTQYCVGKAAREAYFRNLAVEAKNVRVLNYSPGPVETDMIHEIFDHTYDADFKEKFAPNAAPSNVHRKRLTPKETVSKLIAILDKNEFESGSRIDYFDI
uniref:Sepiapterin reductase n=1 Tax=Panagrolaimus sp. JU765 TaxID=591449 RepID=A0AC34RF16_9BILA